MSCCSFIQCGNWKRSPRHCTNGDTSPMGWRARLTVHEIEQIACVTLFEASRTRSCVLCHAIHGIWTAPKALQPRVEEA